MLYSIIRICDLKLWYGSIYSSKLCSTPLYSVASTESLSASARASFLISFIRYVSRVELRVLVLVSTLVLTLAIDIISTLGLRCCCKPRKPLRRSITRSNLAFTIFNNEPLDTIVVLHSKYLVYMFCKNRNS